MIFRGVGRRFSTRDDGQYEEIGAFWDAMAEKYGREKLCGLGWDWTDDSMLYAIGTLDAPERFRFSGMETMEVLLPENGWQRWKGKTEHLDELYRQIYAGGPLTYEIERFAEDGTCTVDIYREQK